VCNQQDALATLFAGLSGCGTISGMICLLIALVVDAT